MPGAGETLRVALAGAGMISRFHLAAWRKVAGVTLVAIADPDRDRAALRAQEFGIGAVHGDLAALLAAEAVDIVDIAAPRQTHAALVRLAARHGAAVLCQKPLAADLAEAERLAADMAGTRVMVHENWRFRPAYRRLRRWIEDASPGRLTQGRIAVHGSGLIADENGAYPALERQPFFRSERRLLIAESLIHHLDVMRWLAGPLRVVAARAARTCDAVAGETCATLMLETAYGAPLVVEGNLTVAGAPGRAGDEMILVFERGAARFAHDQLALSGVKPVAATYDFAESYQASFDAAIAHFVAALRGGFAFETGISDNLETLRLVEDAYRLAGPICERP